MGEEKKGSLEELKENYLELQGRYGLPSFDEMNREFQIEKISGIETDYLIREVAKLSSERLSDFLRFIEGILHPVNGSILVFSILKSIGEKEKKVLAEMYKEISLIELEMIGLGLDFNETKEADFIKKCYALWMEVKPKISGVLDVIRDDWKKDFKINGNGQGYFN